MPDARPRGNPLLSALLVAIVLVVTGWAATAQPRVIYSVNVDQALSQFARYRERRVRVRGSLVPGSLVKRARGCDVKFRLAPAVPVASKQGTLPVHYRGCSLPETFCDLSGPASADSFDEREVHAQGQLSSQNGRIELDAEELVVTCPGKYYARGSSPLCARYRPGDDCPICEHALSARQRQ
jgi:cytochrome c-type biogenesis protein CcmE